jgi:beta-glucanase (GH16 family)
MKNVTLLLKTLFLILCIANIAIPSQAQETGEKHIQKIFYENFSGPVDNQIWQIGTWKEHGGQLSTDRCYVEDGLLNMIFINDPELGYLNSAIQTRDQFFYGRWEASLKPSNVPGVLNSFYTIDWNNTADESADNNGTKQEIDIEFLTNSFQGNTGEVHIALHESGNKSFHSNPDIKLNFNPSSGFHVWGFDITPEYIEWFVDDKVLHRYVYSDNEIRISAPYMLKLNVWTSERWIGGPPEENVECVYQIDWIKFTPYDQLTKADLER